MSEVSHVEVDKTEATVAKKNNKKAAKPKIYPKKLDKKDEPAFEFSGKIESINVRTSVDGPLQFAFGLVGKKGIKNTYALDSTDSVKFSAMTNLLSAALMGASKVKVRSMPNPSGPNVITDFEIRTKG